MNRIILIGNGFDLAHGLRTSYQNFIDWYWDEWLKVLKESNNRKESDILCELTLNYSMTWKEFFSTRMKNEKIENSRKFFYGLNKDISIGIKHSELFLEITKSIESKGWVDIEHDYYKLLNHSFDSRRINRPKANDLNKQLNYIQNRLVEYLKDIMNKESKLKDNIKSIIYGPIKFRDVAVSATDKLVAHVINGLTCSENELKMKLGLYKMTESDFQYLNEYRKEQNINDSLVYTNILTNKYPYEFFLPDSIMFLNFNYTNTTKLYLPIPKPGFEINHIHGELSKPDSVIFGYGDELDENYRNISNLNDNEYLKNFKSIKYLESDRYRKALQFMDAAPFQVYILGHSCGNSDRTLLNTLFEHKNCISVKPYYFKNGHKDNYLDIVQNISRNFKDMKLMRDRVVNKTFCEAFSEK